MTPSLFTSKIAKMGKQLFTAIVFFSPETGIRPRKYRNVDVPSFTRFAARSGAVYFNVYDPVKKTYLRRVYIGGS